MAKKRVIAHYMQDAEQKAAAKAIGDAVVTDSFVAGTIDEAEIPAWRRRV